MHIPQADEQQRLLANMILSMNLDKKPLPRFWYLPNKKKAALLYAIDDHGSAAGTKNAFNTLLSNDTSGCVVADWECLRGTSWLYTSGGLTNNEAESFYNQGFEFGVHVSGCSSCTPYTYDTTYTSDLAAFQAKYTSIPVQSTHRYHQIPWTDWNSHARIEREHSIRFDMNYYYYPPTWSGARPGFMTGSGLPQKFAAIDGSVIDVYQQDTDFTNDNQLVNNTASIAAVLDRALGSEGYYAIVGTHDDRRDTATLSGYLNAISGRDVPMVSAYQVLTWVDGRNNSTFSSLSWDNTAKTLDFTITASSSATNLDAMLPTLSNDGSLQSITRSGSSVSYTTETIKGTSYAFFTASSGNYQATYSGASTPTPTVSSSTSSTNSSSSSSSSDSGSGSPNPNAHTGWKYSIMAGPNFIGILRFIRGVNEAQDAMAFISQDAHHDDVTVWITKTVIDKLFPLFIRNQFPWMQGLNTVSEIYHFKAVSSFNGYPITNFDHPVIIVLPYDPARLNGVSPNDLRIAWYDTDAQQWKLIQDHTVVNKSNHTIANTTTHFSYFAVVYDNRLVQQTGTLGIVDEKSVKKLPVVKQTPTQKLTHEQKHKKASQKRCFLFICW